MPRVPVEQMPDASRVWVFGVSDPLSEVGESTLLATVDAFLDGWAAHGHPLTCARDWRRGRFLLVAVDEATAPPSGCSIDAMVNVLEAEQERLEVTLVDHAAVWYLEDDAVGRVTRAEFKALVEAGHIDADTPVFDNTVTRLSQVREGSWERPARDSWHFRAFFQQPA